MRITKVEFSDYKSIKNPISIPFYQDLPTVLIGKNGSGKTNILEALEDILSSVQFHKKDISYKAEVELSREDFKRYFPYGRYDEKKCRLTVLSDSRGMKLIKIQSEYLVSILKRETEDLESLVRKLKDALEEYTNQLEEIRFPGFYKSDYRDDSLRCVGMRDKKGIINDWELQFKVKEQIEKAENIIKAVSEQLDKEDKTTFTFCLTSDLIGYIPEPFAFELEYVAPKLSYLEERYVTVDEDGIKAEIAQFNRKTKELCDRITDYISKINQRNHALTDTLRSNNCEDNPFFRKLQHLIKRNCYFLRNENNAVIFSQTDHSHYYPDKSDAVLETYLKRVYHGENGEALLKHTASLTEAELKDFEDYLNANLPEFEENMYEKVSVECSEKNKLTIYLHEKTGDVIDFNQTSAGRRWYFTYYFIKSTLESGDWFIIDEPAGMLHPQAQKEVLRELCELKKQGIGVIYSTHSPYLIPQKREAVSFVYMKEGGTEIYSADPKQSIYAQAKDIFEDDIFNLQEFYDIYTDNRETVRKNCYNAVQKYAEKFASKEKCYEELAISEDAVKSWRTENPKKRRDPSFENLLRVAKETETDIRELLKS